MGGKEGCGHFQIADAAKAPLVLKKQMSDMDDKFCGSNRGRVEGGRISGVSWGQQGVRVAGS